LSDNSASKSSSKATVKEISQLNNDYMLQNKDNYKTMDIRHGKNKHSTHQNHTVTVVSAL
jgi:hypothetical protein